MIQSPTSVRRRAPLLAAALALLALVLLTLPEPPQAGSAQPNAAKKKKQKKITGKIRADGAYTVIALAKNGEAKTKRVPNGKFKLRPPAKKVTLHLRAPDGTYAGPIVVRTRKGGKRAIEGVYAGAKLGTIKVKPSQGYAKVLKLKKRQRKKFIDKKREARAKKGVPIGAGNFGRVRSKKFGKGAPGDFDRDGIANPLDVDDDGDLVLDNLDSTPRGKAGASARASGEAGPPLADLFNAYPWLISRRPVNANALPPGPESDALIEASLPSDGQITIGLNDLLGADPSKGDPSINSVELDCGEPQSSDEPGLAYCTLGGTGEAKTGVGLDDPSVPFPACCDSDGDGFGSLFPHPGGSTDRHDLPGGGVGLLHRATHEQIATGDVLIARIEHSDGSPDEELVTSLAYVFSTAPTLVSYDDGQGNSATVDYPVSSEAPEYTVKPGPSGDVVLTLTFWRPQRSSIAGEQGKWIDVGGLGHGTSAANSVGEVGLCDHSAYTNVEPGFTPISVPGALGGDAFRDPAEDRPASPNNTFSYQVNLTKCLELKGRSFGPGETPGFYFGASTARPDAENVEDLAANQVFFKRE